VDTLDEVDDEHEDFAGLDVDTLETKFVWSGFLRTDFERNPEMRQK